MNLVATNDKDEIYEDPESTEDDESEDSDDMAASVEAAVKQEEEIVTMEAAAVNGGDGDDVNTFAAAIVVEDEAVNAKCVGVEAVKGDIMVKGSKANATAKGQVLKEDERVEGYETREVLGVKMPRRSERLKKISQGLDVKALNFKTPSHLEGVGAQKPLVGTLMTISNRAFTFYPLRRCVAIPADRKAVAGGEREMQVSWQQGGQISCKTIEFFQTSGCKGEAVDILERGKQRYKLPLAVKSTRCVSRIAATASDTSGLGVCGRDRVNPCRAGTCIDGGTQSYTCICQPNHRSLGDSCGRELLVYERQQPCTAFYHIQPDDTCSSVAQLLDISNENLQTINPGVNCATPLPAFHSLCVERNPAKAGPTFVEEGKISKVVNFKKVATYFGITLMDLCRLNPWLSFRDSQGSNDPICVDAEYSPPPASDTNSKAPSEYPDSQSSAMGVCGRDRVNPCLAGTCIDSGTLHYTCVCPPNHRFGGRFCGELAARSLPPTPYPNVEAISSITVQGSDWRCKDVYSMYGLTLNDFTTMNEGVDCAVLLPEGRELIVHELLEQVSPCSAFYYIQPCFSVIPPCTALHLHPHSFVLASGVPSITLPPSHVAASSFTPICHPFSYSTSLYSTPLFLSLPQGDTCSSVAQLLDLSYDSMQQLNPGVKCSSFLPAFRSLCVERNPAKARPTCVKKVVIGQVVDFKEVAAYHGTTLLDLCRLNPWLSFRDSQRDSDQVILHI
ncbi:unnamed protein product [Closterium sp. Naga37s-1]|nr:unnamed protein product [Closterium sp. Naga37s-1]